MKDQIIEQLNSEIERLTRARDVLADGNFRGRKRAFRDRGPMSVARRAVRRKRVMSAATRALIAEKMRQAWARGRKKHK